MDCQHASLRRQLRGNCRRKPIRRASGADWLGVALAVGCVVHCVTLPAMLALGPLVGQLGWLQQPWVHQSIALVCFALVLRSVTPRLRRQPDPLTLGCLGAGVGLLFLGACILPDLCCLADASGAKVAGWFTGTVRPLLGRGGSEILMLVQPCVTPLGGMLLAAAHLLSLDAASAGRRFEMAAVATPLPPAGLSSRPAPASERAVSREAA